MTSLPLVVATVLLLTYTAESARAQSVTAAIDLSTTTSAKNDPVFGNTIEPTGAYTFTLAGGGAATIDAIKVQL